MGRAAIGGALAILLAAPPLRAGPVIDLLPHRAAYRLSLADAESGSRLAEIRGALVLEWRPACDGWLSQQRMGFVATSEDGPAFSHDVRFSSWESRDGTQLRFSVRSFDGPRLEEEFRGHAALTAPGRGGVARYRVPEGDSLDLPAGTIFPTAHLAELIAAAHAGERTLSRHVFDGSGENGLSRATAVIGDPAADDRGDPTWPVSIAYFRSAEEAALPQFEIAFELAATGVLRDVRLDYGTFVLRAELERLEPLPRPECR